MPESAGKHGRRSHSHSRSHRAQQPKRRVLGFFKKYKAEIFGALLLSLGIFLLVERLDILAALYAKFGWLAIEVRDYLLAVFDVASAVEVSDMVGIMLILGGVLLLGRRVRARMIGRSAAVGSTDRCPRCGEAMKRAPRRMWHQIAASLLLVRIKCYACTKCPGEIAIWEKKRRASNWQ